MAGKKKLAIIDGKSVFYRGYYAMPNLSTKDGTPTGGVFGFASMALEVIKKIQPDYVCVAWDKPKTNIRKRREMYPEYKAGRKPAPPDFYAQIPLLHELLDAFGWPLYELDDYEADDIMGTLARQASAKGIETALVTSDLDMLQLVDPLVHVYALKKGLSNIELFRPEYFIMKYGLKPEQFLDLKALMGDSSDNIPGVPGVGKKTATQLLTDYKTLDNVYENLGLIKDSVRRKLEAGKDSAMLSKKIASIWTDAPIDLELEKLDMANCDNQAVHDSLQKFEFRSLVRQLPEVMQLESTKDFAKADALTIGKVVSITANAQLKDIQIDEGAEVVVSISENDELIISANPKTVYVVDSTLSDLAKILGPSLASAQLVGYDIKQSLKMLLKLGIQANQVRHDVLIGAFLVNSLRREQTLHELADADLGIFFGDPNDADSKRIKPAEMVAVIRSLQQQQHAQLKDMPKVAQLAADIEWPIIPVLAGMEHAGIELDTEYLNTMSIQLADQISDVEQTIYGHAGREFNISSPGQLSEVLFSDLALPTEGIKKGKTAYSTAASELAKLRGQHEVIDLISKYREYTKLKSTYVDTLPKMVDDTSRLHTNFHLTIAQTGRLSSADPNLQNIPVRTELGRRIRTAFVAGKDKALVSADYSQFELRLAAVLAEDKELIDLFNRDVDIHTATAAQVYGREPEDVTKNMRRDAKVINFGVLYGMSPHGLSAATGMTFKAAKEFIDKYFELRAPILKYLDSLKEKARNDGYVETLFGRRRPMPDIHSKNFAVRQAAERAAINMPIQGTEADLMKMAMIAVDKKLEENFKEAKQLLQIHDSIMVECPAEQAKDIAKMLKTTMEGIYSLPVKLTVDTDIGQNWGEL